MIYIVFSTFKYQNERLMCNYLRYIVKIGEMCPQRAKFCEITVSPHLINEYVSEPPKNYQRLSTFPEK